MYAVVVYFEVKPDYIAEFRAAMLTQAENSYTRESECRLFDVSISSEKDNLFLLYELYDNAAAFQAHLETEHFLDFAEKVKPWIISRDIKTYTRIASHSDPKL